MKATVVPFALVFTAVLAPQRSSLNRTSADPILVRERWVSPYDGSGFGDFAYAIALDPRRNGTYAYVAGYSETPGSVADFVTVGMDPQGKQTWIARYDGNGGSDVPHAAAVDGGGNVYVTGASEGAGTDLDFATVKYDPNGGELWAARYDGPGHGVDYAYALAADPQGNVFVAGESGEGRYSGSDFAVVKYDREGNQIWVSRYDGIAHERDAALFLALDALGNVYVTGASLRAEAQPPFDENFDFLTLKLDPQGRALWVANYNGPGNDRDVPTGLAVDSEGNVYVSGVSFGIGTERDIATVKYGPQGEELWVARYNGPGNGGDISHGIALDTGGNVVVGGYSLGVGSGTDYVLLKYGGSDGKEIWAARYNGPGNGDDQLWALALDSSGNAYASGVSLGAGSGNDFATIKVDPNGKLLWVARYNGAGNAEDQASDLALDPEGNVYVTGWSQNAKGDFDYATLKYAEAKERVHR